MAQESLARKQDWANLPSLHFTQIFTFPTRVTIVNPFTPVAADIVKDGEVSTGTTDKTSDCSTYGAIVDRFAPVRMKLLSLTLTGLRGSHAE